MAWKSDIDRNKTVPGLFLTSQPHTAGDIDLYSLTAVGAGDFYDERPSHHSFNKRCYHRIYVVQPLVQHIEALDELSHLSVLADLSTYLCSIL
jgi:hypothetical protein